MCVPRVGVGVGRRINMLLPEMQLYETNKVWCMLVAYFIFQYFVVSVMEYFV
jgi:hypothetical protein